jgi:hypothetical protein
VSVRLARLGITLPSVEKLGWQGFPGFESEGEEALDWWRRLRAVSEQSGWWPVLLDHNAGALISDAPSSAAELSVIDDPAPEMLEKELEGWPAQTGLGRLDGFHLPMDPWTREPEPVLVTLLPTGHGCQVPTLIGYGGWNRCPAPRTHSAILKRWHERHGAELVCLTRTGLELGLTRPPATRMEALGLAWDYASYCPDGVEAIYQADTLAGLAAGLIDANVLRCWWD